MAPIFQASDLSRKRREVLQAARDGRAQIRDTDGTSLVMIPEQAHRLDRELAAWGRRLLSAHAAFQQPRAARSVIDLGELAWLEAFDDDDVKQFFAETTEAFVRAAAELRLDPLETVIDGWRTTAVALSDERSRGALLRPATEREFVPVSRPTE